ARCLRSDVRPRLLARLTPSPDVVGDSEAASSPRMDDGSGAGGRELERTREDDRTGPDHEGQGDARRASAGTGYSWSDARTWRDRALPAYRRRPLLSASA